jgi:dihydrofolate reductase
VGAIKVHEFMSLDGVIDAPTWTFEYGFDPKMGEAIARITERCQGILLGRKTYEEFYSFGRAVIPPVCDASAISQIYFGPPAAA